MKTTNHSNGISYENSSFYIFFGNKKASNTDKFLNENHFIMGRQLHEAKLLNADEVNTQGSSVFINSSDGLVTSQKNKKLAIITADCIPCFIFDNDKLYSLHLGWRSIQKGLFDLALKDLSENAHVFIGPHILKESFEVGVEIFDLFNEGLQPTKINWFSRKDNGNFHLSLDDILKVKAAHLSLNFTCTGLDTFTSLDHHSYRRDHKTILRNISFAFLKSKV